MTLGVKIIYKRENFYIFNPILVGNSLQPATVQALLRPAWKEKIRIKHHFILWNKSKNDAED